MIARTALKRLGTLVAASLAIGGLAACEPAPPRLQLTVDSQLEGSDDAPGDGTCSSAAAAGACTLAAAIQEGSAAADGADVTVPPGHYRNVTTTVTGDVALITEAAANVAITSSTITVGVGARLSLSGINTSESIAAPPPGFPGPPSSAVVPLQLDVSGTLVMKRSVLAGLHITADGNALMVDSVVGADGTVNLGSLVAVRSSFFADSASGPAGTVLAAAPGATTRLAGSVLAMPHTSTSLGFSFPGGQGTCTGPAPISHDHLFVEVPCGDVDGSGDAGATLHVTVAFTGTGYQETGASYSLRPTSPLVDAIPVGHPACPPGATDVYGEPRGVDGNADGIPGCDIGAVERRPA